MGDGTAEATELWLGAWRAQHIRADGWAVGGTLRVSNRRLTFTPGRPGRWLRRRGWECVLSERVHFGAAPRGRLGWIPNMERKFAVVQDGVLDLFDVVQADSLLSAIQTALATVVDDAS